jgi:hypothetical protein
MNVKAPNINDIGVNYIIRLSDTKLLVSRDKEDASGEQTQSSTAQKKKQAQELSPDEKRVIKELQARDTEVKAHEAAHQASGGGMTGAASYTYQIGPDGKMYAIGGEVSINTPTPSSPQEALKIARQVAAAAMAAGEPSPQDFAVAASARLMEIEAQRELAQEEQKKQKGLQSYQEGQNGFKVPQSELPLLDISA